MQAVLVMFRPEGDRRSFSLTRDMTVIGRREDCDFRIPLGEISRKHCRIIKDEDSIRVEDLGSSNGTYINGQRVQEGTLQAGDTLKVGSIVFVLQVDGAPPDDELTPYTGESAAPAGEDEPASDNVPAEEGLAEEPPIEGTVEGTGELVTDEATGDAASDEFVIDDTAREGAESEGSESIFDPTSFLESDADSSSMNTPLDSQISNDILKDLDAQD